MGIERRGEKAMTALWIVISTVCFNIPIDFGVPISIVYMEHSEHVPNIEVRKCFQQARIESKEPTPKKGETVYRVIPANKEEKKPW